MIKVSYGSKSLESLNRNKNGNSKKQKKDPHQEKMTNMIHSIMGDLESVIRKGIEQQKAGTVDMTEVLESVEGLFGKKANEESDNTFSIDGTAFTAEELQKAVKVLKGVEGEISAHITESKLLDYINYAHFEIARNVVDKFSKKNLNAQQTELVIKALNSFINKAQEVHDTIIERIFEKTQDKYYGYKVTDTAVNDEMTTVTGDKVVASNQELINRITSLFSTADLSDSAAVTGLIKEFEEMVIPAYKEVTEDTEKLEDKLSYDELSLGKTIKNFVDHASDKA